MKEMIEEFIVIASIVLAFILKGRQGETV